MLFKIISIFLLLSCKNIVLNIKLKENCYLPNGCEFGPKTKDETTILQINCNDHLVKYDFSLFNRSNEMCRLKQPTGRTIIMSIRANQKNSILGINSDLLKLVEYSMLYFQPFRLFLRYYDFKGIRIDTKIELKIKISIEFYQTKLYFYDQHNQLIDDCDSFERNNKQFKDFFNPQKLNYLYLAFTNVVYKTPLCETFFKNSKLKEISFKSNYKTYFRKNLVEIRRGSRSESLNSTITSLEIQGYEIHLTQQILNENVFKRTTQFYFNSLDKVENDIFKSIDHISFIMFDAINFLCVVRRQGISWIKSINSNLNVNLSDIKEVNKNIDKITNLRFFSSREYFENDFRYACQ